MDATTQPVDGVPCIDRSTWLRDALGFMAESGVPYLVVTDDATGEPVGTLSFASIQLAAAPKRG
jgi:CBS domain-containing protein